MIHINAPLFSRTGGPGVNGHQVMPTNNGAPLQPLRNQPPRQSSAGSGFQAPPAPTPTKPGITAMKLVVA